MTRDTHTQTTELSTSEINSLLEGMRHLMREREGKLEQFRHEFKRIRDHLVEMKQRSIEEGLLAAPEFNVFRVLGLSRYEVRTHSAMLANLLNPGETHGQRFIFLKSFLEYCHQKDAAFPYPSGEIETAHWDVLTEYATSSYGRMDIVIRSPDLSYLAVIENKIDAWEQTDQLKRYSRWMESQRRDYQAVGLIYLTIQGSRALTAQGVYYLPLSYNTDIPNWLSSTLDRVQAPNVRAAITQYLALAGSL